MRTRENIYFHEWIGMDATVTDSTNPTEIGISGPVCDETKHTVIIGSDGKRRMIVKRGRMFTFATNESRFTINGSFAAFRPEDRIKERRKIERMLRNGD